jgi:2-succinyl-5-enolpyruvyl-6-hydroxy-3-cyclohexene-1-carboxylate synthase
MGADRIGAENAGRAFALVLVDELARHGVTDAVVAPGSRSTPIALALLENSAVRVHVRIDERSASYLALGIARASGRVVPVLCTSGTATAHFLGAVMEADQSRVPLLVLTADRPPELRGIGANQTVDQVGMYGGAVRWACDVGVPESRPDSVRHWRSLVSRAVATATGASGAAAGPVHLNLPLREPLLPVDDGTGFPHDLAGRGDAGPGDSGRGDTVLDSTVWTASPVSSPADVAVPPGLQARVGAARRGVVVAGDGLSRADAHGLLAFAAAAGWPVVAEPHSGARQGPMAVGGAADALLRDDEFTSANRPDLVVVAGRVGLSRALLGWLATVPHVVVDRDGSWWDVTRSALAIVTMPIQDLARLDVRPAEQGWADTWRSAAGRVAAAVDAALDEPAGLTEPQVARDVAALVPAGGALVVGSSMPIRDLDLVMRPRPLRIVANRGVSGIDGFVSTAQGVALVHPGPTYALCGDLSLLHDVNGLLPGPDPRPEITYVVVNNDGGGIFSLLPQGRAVDRAGFERVFGTPHGVSLRRLAAAYDVQHALASTTDELAAALTERGGVRIVEVRTDREANARLHDRLRDIAAAAVRLGRSGNG